MSNNNCPVDEFLDVPILEKPATATYVPDFQRVAVLGGESGVFVCDNDYAIQDRTYAFVPEQGEKTYGCE